MGSMFAADKLKALRQNMGWSQLDLAERIGVSGSMVSMYENGQRMPARETLAKIAKELNVSMDDMISREDGEQQVTHINPLRDKDVDFGFSISRGRSNGGYSLSLHFEGSRPIMKVDGVSDDFAAQYARLQPEDKIAVCKEMLKRAKDELMRG